MTRERELELVQNLDKSLIDVLVSKSKDYATADVLSNFKRLSAAVDALNITLDTPWGYALFMTLMKIDRINNLLSSYRTPSNESVEDSFGDGINYLKLCYCCYMEAKENG